MTRTDPKPTRRTSPEPKLRETRDSNGTEAPRRDHELAAAHAALADARRMLEAIHRAETRFIVEGAGPEVFSDLLNTLLQLTGSNSGLILERFVDPDGVDRLVRRAAHSARDGTGPDAGAHMAELERLCGRAMEARQHVIGDAGERSGDSEEGPTAARPNTFLALSLNAADDCVGVLGLADREGGYDAGLVDYLEPLLASCGNLLAAWRSAQERRDAEESLRRQNVQLLKQKEQLRAANKELEAFTYSVSHDLRAPLRGVDSFSRILIEEYGPQLDDEGRRLLGIVRGEAQRMGILIDDLLQFSRTGRQQLEPTRVDLAELASQVFEAIPPESRRHVEHFDVKPLPGARGDRVMLRQVMANLVGNAVKFTGQTEDARIEVGSAERDGEQVYYVRDNGVGFDPRYAHKLFGVFQRLHAEEEFEGTGVGLAIVQRIIHRHGGKVWAEGVLNEGATFWFSLPRPAEE